MKPAFLAAIATICLPICLLGCSHAPPQPKATDPQQAFADNIKRFDHFIVIYQENWSFDGLYGSFPGANGLSAASSNIPQVSKSGNPLKFLPQAVDSNDKLDRRFPPANGRPALPVAPFDLTKYVADDQITGDLAHQFYREQLQIDGGKMDRFVAWSDNGGLVLSYIDATNLPEGQLAKSYTLCDNFFHSAFGGSFINHHFLIAAAAPQWPDAPSDIIANPDPKHFNDAIMTPDGFAVNTVYSVNSPHPKDANRKHLLPEQTMPTIGDRLDDKNISWKWYAGGWDDALAGHPDPLFQFHHQPFAYYENFKDGAPARAAHLQDEKKFFSDLSAGILPAVTFIKPLGPDNEHPGYANLLAGQNHVAKIVNAVRQSPAWADTVIIITYDENGGRWDHVAPPVIDRFGPGTRVPTIIVSPFVKRGFVDHTQYETVSILRLIEMRFGLAPLSQRDAKADPFTNAFDFAAAARQ